MYQLSSKREGQFINYALFQFINKKGRKRERDVDGYGTHDFNEH
jgi:hypothetical protein